MTFAVSFRDSCHERVFSDSAIGGAVTVSANVALAAGAMAFAFFF
jgi:hypothetical protein